MRSSRRQCPSFMCRPTCACAPPMLCPPMYSLSFRHALKMLKDNACAQSLLRCWLCVTSRLLCTSSLWLGVCSVWITFSSVTICRRNGVLLAFLLGPGRFFGVLRILPYSHALADGQCRWYKASLTRAFITQLTSLVTMARSTELLGQILGWNLCQQLLLVAGA